MTFNYKWLFMSKLSNGRTLNYKCCFSLRLIPITDFIEGMNYLSHTWSLILKYIQHFNGYENKWEENLQIRQTQRNLLPFTLFSKILRITYFCPRYLLQLCLFLSNQFPSICFKFLIQSPWQPRQKTEACWGWGRQYSLH